MKILAKKQTVLSMMKLSEWINAQIVLAHFAIIDFSILFIYFLEKSFFFTCYIIFSILKVDFSYIHFHLAFPFSLFMPYLWVWTIPSHFDSYLLVDIVICEFSISSLFPSPSLVKYRCKIIPQSNLPDSFNYHTYLKQTVM